MSQRRSTFLAALIVVLAAAVVTGRFLRACAPRGQGAAWRP
ncbi:MAG: hypothetical protein NTX64_18740 [Elusimicrobia bacterium]|nr:hypothetical protein [Elusimicrobiota bacterium]